MIPYDAGMDIMADGGCLWPQDLPRILANERGHNNLDALFAPEEETAAVRLFHISIENEKRKVEEKCADEAEAQAKEAARRMEFETAPFFPAAPWKALWTTYGVANGEVYINKSIVGLKFGSHSLRLSDELRIDATGIVWGNVVFRDNTGEPVTWENVFRPQAIRRKIKRII